MSKLSEGKEIRFRVSHELWNKVRKLAIEDDRTITELVRRLLKDVVAAYEERVPYLYLHGGKSYSNEPNTNPTAKEDSSL